MNQVAKVSLLVLIAAALSGCWRVPEPERRAQPRVLDLVPRNEKRTKLMSPSTRETARRYITDEDGYERLVVIEFDDHSRGFRHLNAVNPDGSLRLTEAKHVRADKTSAEYIFAQDGKTVITKHDKDKEGKLVMTTTFAENKVVELAYASDGKTPEAVDTFFKDGTSERLRFHPDGKSVALRFVSSADMNQFTLQEFDKFGKLRYYEETVRDKDEKAHPRFETCSIFIYGEDGALQCSKTWIMSDCPYCGPSTLEHVTQHKPDGSTHTLTRTGETYELGVLKGDGASEFDEIKRKEIPDVDGVPQPRIPDLSDTSISEECITPPVSYDSGKREGLFRGPKGETYHLERLISE